MCIVFFGRNKLGIFITFNRDEFITRETLKLDKIDKSFSKLKNYSENIIYSKDVPSEGTFFAINSKTYDFCFLLNNNFKKKLFNPNNPQKRGEICLNICSISYTINDEKEYIKSIKDFVINKLHPNDNNYNGYNILFGNLIFEKIYYYTNNNEFYSDNKYILNYFNETEIADYNATKYNIYSNKNIKVPYEFDLLNNKIVYCVSNYSLFEVNEYDKSIYGIQRITDCISKLDQDIMIKDNKVNNSTYNIYLDKFSNYVLSIMSDNTKIGIDDNKFKLEIEKIKAEDNEIISINDYHTSMLKPYIKSSIYVDNYYDNVYFEYGTRQNYFIQTINEKIDTNNTNKSKFKVIIKECFGNKEQVSKTSNKIIYKIDYNNYSKAFTNEIII